MAVAQLDLDRIGIDDQARRDVRSGARQRRRRVVVGGGAGKILAPAAGAVLEDDNSVVPADWR